jgi:hypothetical protein
MYQLYQSYRRQMDAAAADQNVKPPDFADLRAEINRVGTTLIKMMEVSR